MRIVLKKRLKNSKKDVHSHDFMQFDLQNIYKNIKKKMYQEFNLHTQKLLVV